MRQAGWSRLPSKRDYGTLAYRAAMYEEATRTDGMQDYMATQRTMREGIIRELCDGTLDKYGNTNDCCKRAVLHYLNVALGHVAQVHDDFDKARAMKDQQDAAQAMSRQGPLHAV